MVEMLMHFNQPEKRRVSPKEFNAALPLPPRCKQSLHRGLKGCSYVKPHDGFLQATCDNSQVKEEFMVLNISRAMYRFKQRMISFLLLPSEIRRET